MNEQKRPAEHVEKSHERLSDPERDGSIATDVREAYEESDLPPSRSRDRAADAEEKAERSGQAEEPPGSDEKGTGALEYRKR